MLIVISQSIDWSVSLFYASMFVSGSMRLRDVMDPFGYTGTPSWTFLGGIKSKY